MHGVRGASGGVRARGPGFPQIPAPQCECVARDKSPTKKLKRKLKAGLPSGAGPGGGDEAGPTAPRSSHRARVVQRLNAQ